MRNSSILLKGFAGQVAGAIRLLEKMDVAENRSGAMPTNQNGQLTHLFQTSQQQARTIRTLESKIKRLEQIFGELQLLKESKQSGTKAKKTGDTKATQRARRK